MDDAVPAHLLSAYTVDAGLVQMAEEGGGRGGGAGRGATVPEERLSLADTVAPHWFTPPDGTFTLHFN